MVDSLWELCGLGDNSFREYECETEDGALYVRFSKNDPAGIDHVEIGFRNSRDFLFTRIKNQDRPEMPYIDLRKVNVLNKYYTELSLLPDVEILELIDLPKLAGRFNY